jgi:serine/threonine protein kinase
VFQCQNKETQDVIAVKHIVKGSLTERERDFLREELQIIRLIAHPNIVQMREIYETEKNIYIVMEQVRGGELFDHIKTYELEEREVALCMFELLQAIMYMHQCGVIHRDLKPENILIEKDPNTEEVSTIKVTDFGLSKIATPNETMNESCGTPAYVAPEVLHKKGYKREVDIWSAGVIFYTLVCRQLPFQMCDRKQTFTMIKERDPNMSNSAFDRFIPETKDLIMRMLTKLPQQRIAPAEALEHDFFKKLGFSLKKTAAAQATPDLGVIEESKAGGSFCEDEVEPDVDESPDILFKKLSEYHRVELELHSRNKLLKEGDNIDRMRHDNYLDDPDRQSKLKAQKSFHLSTLEQRMIKQDPVMLRLAAKMAEQTGKDGRRSLAFPGGKSKPVPVDLTKLTEAERLRLHRKLMKARVGQPVTGDDSSSDIDCPEYMYPETGMDAEAEKQPQEEKR